MLKIWWTAIRPASLIKIVLPILIGVVWGVSDTGLFNPILALIALVFAWLDQIAIILLNDYADASADTLHTERFPMLIDSRAIPHGALKRRDLLIAGSTSAAALVGVGGILAGLFDRHHAPWLAVVALSLIWAYSFPPIRLNYRGMGELLETAGVGAVLPISGYYICSGRFPDSPFVLFPLLSLAFSSAVSSGLKHLPADRETGKKTMAVFFGHGAARVLILLGTLLGIGASVALVFLGRITGVSLFFTVPLPVIYGLLSLKHAPKATHENLRSLRAFKGCLNMAALSIYVGIGLGLATG
jgi:1,4-dihydroxy-2-naphthoate octaprenyltransferase